MKSNLLDIYSDYLICQNKHATDTVLSDMLSGDISDDKITRYLNYEDLGSKDFWRYINQPIKYPTYLLQIASDCNIIFECQKISTLLVKIYLTYLMKQKKFFC